MAPISQSTISFIHRKVMNKKNYRLSIVALAIQAAMGGAQAQTEQDINTLMEKPAIQITNPQTGQVSNQLPAMPEMYATDYPSQVCVASGYRVEHVDLVRECVATQPSESSVYAKDQLPGSGEPMIPVSPQYQFRNTRQCQRGKSFRGSHTAVELREYTPACGAP